jgi:hypothetical protein
MNQSQQDVMDRVFELLSEHFDHVVVAVGTYDEDKQYTTAASYTGGVAPAIGLCKLYEKKWTKEHSGTRRGGLISRVTDTAN